MLIASRTNTTGLYSLIRRSLHASLQTRQSSIYASPQAFTQPLAHGTYAPVLDRKNPLTKALHSLEKAVEGHDVVHALRVCTSMKRAGIKPTEQFYRLLMALFEERGMFKEMESLFEDAVALGVNPDREMWNYLLKARSNHPFELFNTLAAMRAANIEPNATTYRTLITHHATSKNILMCLRILSEMKQKEVAPDITTVETVVQAACEEHLPRLAFELAKEYEVRSTRRLTLESWTRVLGECASGGFNEGMQEAWTRVVQDGGITPDEGLSTLVLSAAGTAGLPTLAQSALTTLQTLNVTLQEYHLAPLLLSYTVTGDIPSCLEVFDLIAAHGIQPGRFTIRPVVKMLMEEDHLDVAIEWMRARAESGKGGNVDAFNCALRASLKDTNRTIALGQEMTDLRIPATVETYNILIHSACLRRNIPALHSYYSALIDAGLTPNKETFERIIVLLTGEPVYEDAFLYLHKMQGMRIVPSKEVMIGLAKKCAIRFDARWKGLVKAMERAGYEVDDELMDFLAGNGRGRKEGELVGDLEEEVMEGSVEDGMLGESTEAKADFR